MPRKSLSIVCGHGFRVGLRALVGRERLSVEEIEEKAEHQAFLFCVGLLLLFWCEPQQQRAVAQHLHLAGSRSPEELTIRAGVTRYGVTAMASKTARQDLHLVSPAALLRAVLSSRRGPPTAEAGW